MIEANSLTELRSIIYTLCRENGFRAQLYRTTQVPNLQTGQRVTTRVAYKLRHVAFLPNQLYRDFGFGMLMKLSTVISFGGVVDLEQRKVIIDTKELPDGFTINIATDYIVFNHKRYEIKDVTEMEEIDYYLVTVKEVKGSNPYEIYPLVIRDYLPLTHSYNDTAFSCPASPQRLSDWRAL